MRAPPLLALAALTVLGACASTPPTQAPAAPVKAAPAATASATAPAASPTTAPGGVSIETYNKARQEGYRSKTINGRTIFCRTEAGIGTRIAKESCVSSDSLEESLRQAEMVREQMRRGNACGADSCAGK